MNTLSTGAAAAGAWHFTIAYWCVLLAAVLPIACAAIAKARAPGLDNHQPRVWQAGLQGWRARAMAAQSNGFESLPFFIGAVVIAHQLAAPQGWLDLLAMGWVVTRVAYCAIYIAGGTGVRSGVFLLGFALNVAILFLGYR